MGTRSVAEPESGLQVPAVVLLSHVVCANCIKPNSASPVAPNSLVSTHFAVPILFAGYPAQLGAPLMPSELPIEPEVSNTIRKYGLTCCAWAVVANSATLAIAIHKRALARKLSFITCLP